MSAPHSFEDLDAWLAARSLANEVYGLCEGERLRRDWGLCDQLRRAAVSVMNNIAEGWESLHVAEKRQGYNYARRSCGEVRSMSYLLLDRQFITREEQQNLFASCVRTGKLVTGLLRSLGDKS